MTNSECDCCAIAAVKARYFRFMDLKDWTSLRGVFADDARFDHPTLGIFENIDNAVEALKELIGDHWTSHEGSIPDVTITGPNAAHGIFAMTGHAIIANDEMGRSFGHYYDDFVRLDGVWKLSSLRLESTRRTV